MAEAVKRTTDTLSGPLKNFRYILLDIEGTTTSISFVKNQLFPYVRDNLEKFLTDNWANDEVQQNVSLLKEQYKADKEAKVEGLIDILDDGGDEEIKSSLIKNILWQMDTDRKTTALKQLQGHMWKKAYEDKSVVGHLFSEVATTLREWHSAGRQLFVFSSGSVDAQKLLFGHSCDGNLLDLFSNYFDTKIGGKLAKESYEAIAKTIDAAPEDILFLTDVPKEAAAAKEANLEAVLVIREGNAPLSDEDRSRFITVTSFTEIVFENAAKKPKTDSVNNDSSEPIAQQQQENGTKAEASTESEGTAANTNGHNEKNLTENDNEQVVNGKKINKEDKELVNTDDKTTDADAATVNGATVDNVKDDEKEPKVTPKKSVMTSNDNVTAPAVAAVVAAAAAAADGPTATD